jgi:hypothetical protein
MDGCTGVAVMARKKSKPASNQASLFGHEPEPPRPVEPRKEVSNGNQAEDVAAGAVASDQHADQSTLSVWYYFPDKLIYEEGNKKMPKKGCKLHCREGNRAAGFLPTPWVPIDQQLPDNERIDL